MAEMIPIYYLTVEIIFIPGQTLSDVSLSSPTSAQTPSLQLPRLPKHHLFNSHALSSTSSMVDLSLTFEILSLLKLMTRGSRSEKLKIIFQQRRWSQQGRNTLAIDQHQAPRLSTFPRLPPSQHQRDGGLAIDQHQAP